VSRPSDCAGLGAPSYAVIFIAIEQG
jgi:hypothetical protein